MRSKGLQLLAKTSVAMFSLAMIFQAKPIRADEDPGCGTGTWDSTACQCWSQACEHECGSAGVKHFDCGVSNGQFSQNCGCQPPL